MATINKKVKFEEVTHGGGRAIYISPVEQLRRSVMSNLLWEDEFYEEGTQISKRICTLIAQCEVSDVAKIAVEAKRDMHLRHVPLLMARELMRTKEGRKQLQYVLPGVVTRPDDITELLAMYLSEKKANRAPAKLPNQLKKHLGKCFEKFDEYQLAKWNGGSKAVSLKDAMKLTHPKAKNVEQVELWGRLVKDKLKTPDTWETALSAVDKDSKKAEWERLLKEERLSGLAMLRNIRNMKQAGVEESLIRTGIQNINTRKLLPINFIISARHNIGFEKEIEERFLDCTKNKPKLLGKTILVIDTSGSMGGQLSSKSELDRRDVAAGLAMIAREICEEPVIYCTAGNDGNRRHATMQIPARRGFALTDYIKGGEVSSKIGGGGIFLVQCMDFIKKEQKTADRIIVITDEQDCDTSSKDPQSADTFGTYNYLINIANAKNGIGYRKWVHIDGWSDKVLDFIIQKES